MEKIRKSPFTIRNCPNCKSTRTYKDGSNNLNCHTCDSFKDQSISLNSLNISNDASEHRKDSGDSDEYNYFINKLRGDYQPLKNAKINETNSKIKSIREKIDKIIILDQDISHKDFTDLILIIRTANLSDQKDIMRIMKKVLEQKSKFSKTFFNSLDRQLLKNILDIFSNEGINKQDFLLFLKKVKTVNVSHLDYHKAKIEGILGKIMLGDSETKKEGETKHTKMNSEEWEMTRRREVKKPDLNNSTAEIETHKDNALFEISKKLTETHRDLTEMKKKFDKKCADFEDLKSKLKNSESDKKLVGMVKTELEKKLINMEQQKEFDQIQKRALKEQSARDASAMVAKVELLETENVRLREKERHLKSQTLNDGKIKSDLESEGEKLSKQNSEMARKIEILSKNCGELQRSFEALKSMASSQLTEAGELYKKKVMKLKSSLKENRETDSKLKTAELNLKNTTEDLKTQMGLKEQFKGRVGLLEADHKRAESKCAELLKTLKESKRRIEELESEVLTATQIKQQFMNQLLEKQETLAKLQEQIKTQAGASDEYGELKKHMRLLVRENHELKSRLYDETERNKKTKEENKELLVYLDKLLKERGE